MILQSMACHLFFFLAHCHPDMFLVGKNLNNKQENDGEKNGPQQKPVAFCLFFTFFGYQNGGATTASAFAKYLASSGRKGRYCGDSRSKHLMSRWSGEIKAAGLKMLNKTESYRGGNLYPIGSMYGIFTYIYHEFIVNVGKYTIHGSSGYDTNPKLHAQILLGGNCSEDLLQSINLHCERSPPFLGGLFE